LAAPTGAGENIVQTRGFFFSTQGPGSEGRFSERLTAGNR